MRQPGLGKLEWIEEDVKREKKAKAEAEGEQGITETTED
jgi:hypothetical protein